MSVMSSFRRSVGAALLAFAATGAAHAFDLQGHRGARGLAPENTLAAFRTAMAIGVDTLELDVHLSADGIPMVTHDPALNRDITRTEQGEWLPGPGPLVKSLTAEQLRTRYRVERARPDSTVARNFPGQRPSDGERMPTLQQVLALLRMSGAEALRANIEIKINPRNPDDTPPLETVVRTVLDTIRAAEAERRVTIQGFDWRVQQLVQKLAPEIPTAYLSTQRPNSDNINDSRLRHQDPRHAAEAGQGRRWRHLEPEPQRPDAAAGGRSPPARAAGRALDRQQPGRHGAPDRLGRRRPDQRPPGAGAAGDAGQAHEAAASGGAGAPLTRFSASPPQRG
jgi:glycerophosphoryl diester phosphodiesterase